MEQQLYELFVQNNGYLASKLIRGNRSLYYQLKTMLMVKITTLNFAVRQKITTFDQTL